MKLKIGIIGPSFGYGGANLVAAAVGKQLAENHDVYFLPYEDEANVTAIPSKRFCSLVQQRSIWQKKIIQVKKGIELGLQHQLTPSRYIDDEFKHLIQVIQQEQLDVIILNSYVAIVRFCSRIKALFPQIKLIAWLHEDPDYASEVTKNYRPVFEESLQQADKVICLSQKAWQVYQQLNPQTEIIYNPLILASTGKSDLRQSVISFTTRLDIEIKGLDLLCEVAKSLPDPWVIKVAGQGSEKEEAAFNELVNQMGVTTKIQFVGPLTGDELAAHYLNSSIFLSTSRTEALPLVMIEALSFGLPIISFDHSGAKELLENGKDGILIADLNTTAMGKAVNHLIEQPAERQAWQVKSLKRAKEFSVTTVMKKWERVLNEWREKDE